MPYKPIYFLIALSLLGTFSCTSPKSMHKSWSKDISGDSLQIIKSNFNRNTIEFYSDTLLVRTSNKLPHYEFAHDKYFTYHKISTNLLVRKSHSGHRIDTLPLNQGYVHNRLKDLHNIRKLQRISRKKITSETYFQYSFKSKHNQTMVYIKFDTVTESYTLTELYVNNKYYINDSTIYLIKPWTGAIENSISIAENAIVRWDPVSSNDQVPLHTIDSIIALTQISDCAIGENSRNVVIYSYLSCAPCHKLKNELTEIYNDGKLDKYSLAVVNVRDSIKAIENYISNKKIPFPYYSLEISTFTGSYPRIAAYEAGELVWVEEGYSTKTLNKIIKFLEQ